MQIAGSSAIVVGGAGGLGEATVRRLQAAGAKVVVADLADEKGAKLEKELGVRYVPTDATSEESVLAAIAEAEALAPLRISVDTHGGPAAGGRLGRIALELAPPYLSEQAAADTILAQYAEEIGCDVETVLAARRYVLTGDRRALDGTWL